MAESKRDYYEVLGVDKNADEATIKKVYKGNTGIELKAVNPYYPPRIYSEEDIKELPIQIIGVVEKSIRNFNKK